MYNLNKIRTVDVESDGTNVRDWDGEIKER